MNMFLREIGQVAIFLICAQTLLHFRANDSYEKYIKLLISMILLLLLAEPFLNLLTIEEGSGFMDKVQGYEQRLETIMGSGLLKEEEVEAFLTYITNEKVEQGVEYVEAMENQQKEAQGVNEDAVQDIEPYTQIIIEKVELGGQNGEF